MPANTMYSIESRATGTRQTTAQAEGGGDVQIENATPLPSPRFLGATDQVSQESGSATIK